MRWTSTWLDDKLARMNDDTRVIRLTNGGFTLVDAEQFDELNKVRWNLAPSGHVRRSGANKTGVYMHRLIMQAPKGVEIDHRNRNARDNRKCNLRFCTRSQNMANTLRTAPRKGSRFRGVIRHECGNYKRWVAQIKVNYKYHRLGYFKDEVEAARAYDAAAKLHFGEFARINGV